MDAFSYTDIFDTKGIEYIVVIFFLLTLIPVWLYLVRPAKAAARPKRSQVGISAQMLRVLPGLFYGRNHTWTHLEPSGEARLGVDDLLMHLAGGVSVEYLKSSGQEVRAGDPVVKLHSDGRSLQIKSPVSGKIINTNNKLAVRSGILLDDPYGHGWMLKIKPANWKKDTMDLRVDKEAIQWTEGELERFREFLPEAAAGKTTSPVMQTGGELVDFPLESLPGSVWERFQQEFLD